MKLFRRTGKQEAIAPTRKPEYDLDSPLLFFGENQAWSIRDACEGTQIFGMTGSGKTSGSGSAIAKAFLQSGFGGLVLTVKPDERELWEQYARETGRSEHLVIFSPTEKWRFNFMDYEMRREGGGETENIVSLFFSVLEMSSRGQQSSNDGYWTLALKQLLRNTIDLLSIAKGSVSLPDMYKVIISTPKDIEEADKESWQQGDGLCASCLREADAKPKTPMQESDLDMTFDYFMTEFANLADRTRSIIVSTFTSMADCFLRGTLRELFCGETNFVPETTYKNGAIIVMDLPVKQYAELGKFSQGLFKFIWQQAIERRSVSEYDRPVFLWADESQEFVSSYDRQFQSTARSSRACTVYLTQNLDNYYASVGAGDMGRSEIEAFLGNLNTKIFHANVGKTNEWGSDLIAKTWQTRASSGMSAGEQGSTASTGVSESLEHQVQPIEFQLLRKGGIQNQLIVDSIIFQGGRTFGEQTYARCEFKQG